MRGGGANEAQACDRRRSHPTQAPMGTTKRPNDNASAHALRRAQGSPSASRRKSTIARTLPRRALRGS